jgi:hypothetical protein
VRDRAVRDLEHEVTLPLHPVAVVSEAVGAESLLGLHGVAIWTRWPLRRNGIPRSRSKKRSVETTVLPRTMMMLRLATLVVAGGATKPAPKTSCHAAMLLALSVS